MAQTNDSKSNGPEGMLTLVCITCGNEMFFTTKPPKDEPCPDAAAPCSAASSRRPCVMRQPSRMLEDTTRSISLESAPPSPPRAMFAT